MRAAASLTSPWPALRPLCWHASRSRRCSSTTTRSARSSGPQPRWQQWWTSKASARWGVDLRTFVDNSDAVKDTKRKARDDLTPTLKKELSEEEEYSGKRKQIQEKLIKFATRIPAFINLTDFRENTLHDVTGLSVEDFNLHVSLGVFNSEHINQAVFAFRRPEHAWLSCTGINSHERLRRYGLYDTFVAIESAS